MFAPQKSDIRIQVSSQMCLNGLMCTPNNLKVTGSYLREASLFLRIFIFYSLDSIIAPAERKKTLWTLHVSSSNLHEGSLFCPRITQKGGRKRTLMRKSAKRQHTRKTLVPSVRLEIAILDLWVVCANKLSLV